MTYFDFYIEHCIRIHIKRASTAIKLFDSFFFSFQSKSQNKEKLNEKLAEIFAKIGSKENTREVCWIHFTLYNFAFAAFSFSMAQVGTSMRSGILLCG